MRAQDDGRAAFSPRVRHVASLSALYLARPQRLVGCSLPPHVPRATTAEGNATKGFVTLAVPHILESAASAQTLPSTSLVRFRWRHEENQRGSLFQPAKIANGGHGTHLMNADDDDIEDEASDNKIKRDGRRGSTPRSIEMVYPISVNAERFVEYLREMRELVFDVIDRDTRRIYGKCTIPIFETSSTFGSNPRGSQQTTRAEHLLEQVKREDALYEIKSVHPTDQDDMIVSSPMQMTK
uniref:C2CD3 N-terminal C2 domain-containing protein n=1 Tax=Globisporangium ultimum (strain ATCC 200006 / CBS 805.95 / DAOM BR144) TaxID=431595 RepID=K3X1Y3_GLOUD